MNEGFQEINGLVFDKAHIFLSACSMNVIKENIRCM